MAMWSPLLKFVALFNEQCEEVWKWWLQEKALHEIIDMTQQYLNLHWKECTVVGVVLLYSLHVLLKPSEDVLYERSLQNCWNELLKYLEESNSHPLLLRLAFADAVSYDHTIGDWPFCGGTNGNIRFESTLSDPFNAGLDKAISILQPFKSKYYRISWSDLIQMGGAAAVKGCGGPTISLNYGRIDVDVDLREMDEFEARKLFNPQSLLQVSREDIRNRHYPVVFPPYPYGELTADMHLRNIFYRMGMNNRDIVALCGAHTIGRGFSERSGVCPFSLGDQGSTKYTKITSMAKGDKALGAGLAGGASWTKNWLVFDNSYYRRPYDNPDDEELLWLPTDDCLYTSPEFRPFFEIYANNQQKFFEDYSAAHQKMSELGAKFKKYYRIRNL